MVKVIQISPNVYVARHHRNSGGINKLHYVVTGILLPGRPKTS